jgi:hypothetical protein
VKKVNNTIVFPILITAFLFLGTIFIGLGIGFKSVIDKKAAVCTARTEAVVTEMNREVNLSAGTDSYRSWFPVFSYWAKGEEITVRSKIGNEKKIFEEGQNVELYYNPDNIREYYVPAENVSFLPKVFIGVGGTFAALGIVSFLIMRVIS